MIAPATRTSPDAQHRCRQVCERGEIARRSDRALARDHRADVAIQHGFQHGDGLRAHAGGALAEACELERHHQPYVHLPHRLAHASGVREHDIALQGREVGGADTHARKFAETGVDAVHR
jgi:hypothetical protein